VPVTSAMRQPNRRQFLSENSVADSVTINVTKGTASATIELGGSGSVSISET